MIKPKLTERETIIYEKRAKGERWEDIATELEMEMKDVWEEERKARWKLRGKSKRVEIRFSFAQFNEVKEKADLAGVSISELVRGLALQTKIKKTRPQRPLDEYEKKLSIEIARLGGSLNQIAKHCNYYKNDSNGVKILTALMEIEQEMEVIANAIETR